MKRFYFPNGIINDKRLPFEIQITTGLTVYYHNKGSSQLFKADSYYNKKIQTLNISIQDYTIIVKGRNKPTEEQKINKQPGDYIYEIKHKGKKLLDSSFSRDEVIK